MTIWLVTNRRENHTAKRRNQDRKYHQHPDEGPDGGQVEMADQQGQPHEQPEDGQDPAGEEGRRGGGPPAREGLLVPGPIGRVALPPEDLAVLAVDQGEVGAAGAADDIVGNVEGAALEALDVGGSGWAFRRGRDGCLGHRDTPKGYEEFSPGVIPTEGREAAPTRDLFLAVLNGI